MSWTDERVDLLKKLWSEGFTASQIASKLGGVSRNAVIGKVHRLKLESRGNSSKGSSGKARRPATSPRASSGGGTRRPSGGSAPRGTSSVNAGGRTMTTVTQTVGATVMKAEVEGDTLAELDTRPIEDVVVPIARKLTLVELTETTCKFPYGDPLSDDFHFCGHDVVEGTPYCKYHGKMIYQQPQDRRKKS